MYIKVNDYVLPDSFVAMSNVGENNKRYIEIVGELKAPTKDLCQSKVDQILAALNSDDNVISIDSEYRNLSCKKNTSASVVHDMFGSPHTALIRVSYRAEDKAIYEATQSVSSTTKQAIVYISGNADSYPVITVSFTGASADISISNSLTDQTFDLTKTFVDGDVFVMDSAKRELFLNGTIMINESEDAEFIKMATGRNVIDLVVDDTATMKVEYEDKSL
jgi:phage-related protein